MKSKNYRKIPKYNPKPEIIARLQRYFQEDAYARFYGNYTTQFGRNRRFSFEVKLDQDPQKKHAIIRAVCGRLLHKRVPIHEPGQIFSVDELLHDTEWITIRRLEQYKVGMRYE